jgi:type III pantothenate kinase
VILCVDIGNSRLKWAAGPPDGDWSAHGEWPLDLPQAAAMADRWGALDAPRQIVVSAVAAAAVRAQLTQWCRSTWRMQPLLVQSAARGYGVVNGYADPAQLGADRWAALIAARHLEPRSAACVVDCGTAITVDALDEGGRFVAGAILPGVELARSALRQGTSGVRPGKTGTADLRVRDTAQAVTAGIQLGLAGAVERLVDAALEIAGEPATVFLTGGGASQLGPLLRRTVRRQPDLVLRGLRVIAGGRA